VSRIRDLHTGWMKEPAYRAAYDSLEREFTLAAALIRARADAGLTQEQLAERMGSRQEAPHAGKAARFRPQRALPHCSPRPSV
jgi:hypothetical protein